MGIRSSLGQRAAAWLHLAIGTLILTLVLRTWLVLGLIAPVMVSGSSMAPALVGPHVMARCPKCQQATRIAADSLPRLNPTQCAYCQEGHLDWAHAKQCPGSRIWIDRGSLQWGDPQRWEMVVFHSPWLEPMSEDPDALCVKRVLGLPGEQVRLVDGDLLINNRLQVKTLAEQYRLRQLIRRNPDLVVLSGKDGLGKRQVLFHADHPFTDEVHYNGRLSRKLQPVHDFMLSVKLACQGRGRLEWTVDDGRRPLRIQIQPASGAVRLLESNRLRTAKTLSESSRRRLAEGEVTLELSTFDRQLLLAIDGRVELRFALQPRDSPTGTMEPFAVATTNLTAKLHAISLWRDVYYSPRPVGFGSRAVPGSPKGVATDHQAAWQLAAAEFFLVGDNGPVSMDSRVWPHAGIPRQRLVGRLMGGKSR